jgi:hypothetical protein
MRIGNCVAVKQRKARCIRGQTLTVWDFTYFNFIFRTFLHFSNMSVRMTSAMRIIIIVAAVIIIGFLFTHRLGPTQPVSQAFAQVVEGGHKQMGLQRAQKESVSQQQPDEHYIEELRSIQMDQNDHALLPIIRSVLVPPSNLPYKLDTNSESSHGHAQLIRKLFRNKVNQRNPLSNIASSLFK